MGTEMKESQGGAIEGGERIVVEGVSPAEILLFSTLPGWRTRMAGNIGQGVADYDSGK